MDGDQDDQGVLVNVVVESPEELRQKKRQKAFLFEQYQQIFIAHEFTERSSFSVCRIIWSGVFCCVGILDKPTSRINSTLMS